MEVNWLGFLLAKLKRSVVGFGNPTKSSDIGLVHLTFFSLRDQTQNV